MSDTFDQQQQPNQWPAAPRGNGMAVASLVLGLSSIVLMCWPYVSIICGVLAIIFGVIGRGNARKGAGYGGMATAGLILGIFGVALPLLLIAGCLAMVGLAAPEVLDAVQEAAEQASQNMPAPPTPQ